jgi:hypothetical protein
MLVHLCIDCARMSLNHMAADDDIEKIWEIYTNSCETHDQAVTWPAES